MLTLLLLFPASIFSIVFYLLPSQSTARRSQPHDSFWCTRDMRFYICGSSTALLSTSAQFVSIRETPKAQTHACENRAHAASILRS